MNFIVNNLEIFRQIHLYTELIQEISTSITDHQLAFYVFRKVLTMLASKSSNILPPSLRSIMNNKGQFKGALKDN
jgi:hypothetical protein